MLLQLVIVPKKPQWREKQLSMYVCVKISNFPWLWHITKLFKSRLTLAQD